MKYFYRIFHNKRTPIYVSKKCITPFNLSITDLYNHEIAVGDCSDITRAIYRLQSNSCQSHQNTPTLRVRRLKCEMV
jgi:hypothetical protein